MNLSSFDQSRRPWYRLSLTTQIVLGLVIGVLIGWLKPEWGNSVYFLRDIFLNLIKAVIGPLVFSTLVVGIAGSGSLRKVGRMGIKALIYFEIVTTAALFIGLAVVNLVQPGVGISLAGYGKDAVKNLSQAQPRTLIETLTHVFPSSVIDSLVRGDILQIVAFAVLFAMAVSAIGDQGKPIIRGMESLAQVMFKMTNYVMRFAPFGVGAAMAHTVGAQGLGVLRSLGALVLTYYGSLVLFVVLVFGIVMLLARVPFRQFLRAIREPAVLAFATTSSEAAMPKAMEAMERLGVPKRIVGFVMPTGYSFNMDGAMVFFAVSSMFIVQAAGPAISQPFGFGHQLAMMLTFMVTSKGVAGVPRAGVLVLLATLTNILPLDVVAGGIAIVLSIDAIMDMGRSAVNLSGNALATIVIARWEGEFDDQRARVFGTPEEAALDLKEGDVAFAESAARGD